MLVRSWDQMVQLEAWNDFLRTMKDWEQKLTDEWRMGIAGSERNQRAALVLSKMPLMHMAAQKRLDNYVQSKKQRDDARRFGTRTRG